MISFNFHLLLKFTFLNKSSAGDRFLSTTVNYKIHQKFYTIFLTNSSVFFVALKNAFTSVNYSTNYVLIIGDKLKFFSRQNIAIVRRQNNRNSPTFSRFGTINYCVRNDAVMRTSATILRKLCPRNLNFKLN